MSAQRRVLYLSRLNNEGTLEKQYILIVKKAEKMQLVSSSQWDEQK